MIIVNTSIVFSNWLSSVEYLLQGLDSIAIYQCYLTGCSSVWFHYLSHEHNWIICKNTCYDQWCIPGTPHDEKLSFADWLWSCDLTQIVWLDRKVEYLGQKVEDSEEKKEKMTLGCLNPLLIFLLLSYAAGFRFGNLTVDVGSSFSKQNLLVLKWNFKFFGVELFCETQCWCCWNPVLKWNLRL